MKEIDWSKAPAGATHYRKDSALPWRMLEDGEWYCWEPDEENWIAISDPIPEQYFPIGDRPAAAWAGEGLPPAGTVCEVLNNMLDRPEWERCTILFMGKFKAIYESESCHERVADVSEDWMISFRPLRTPEQIAAEERLHSVRNACSAIAETLDALRGKTKLERAALRVVEAMIDAGYAR